MKQAELGKELGKTAMQIGRIRKQVCSAEDYNEKTRELTPAGVQKIKDHCDDSVIEPQYVAVKILEFPKNPRFVIGKTMAGTNSTKVPACVPANIKQSLRVGQIIKCQVITYEGMDYYRHEKLVDGYYPSIPQKA